MMSEVNPKAEFLEPHYTPAELAKSWHMSPDTVRAWFSKEPGVLRFGVKGLHRGRQRGYVTMKIPESVARRVYRRKTGKPE